MTRRESSLATSSHPLLRCLVGSGRYQVNERIAGGSFGEIFLGSDTQSRQIVAIKAERARTAHPQLAAEARFYAYLCQGKRGKSIMPAFYYYGTEGDFNVMVMELLGKSLEDLLTYCDGRFSLKTTLMLGIELVSRMEFLHSKSVLHRDIKPDNFMMGQPGGPHQHKLFVIDFGLTKRYRDPRTHQHIPYKEGKSLTGTARYCSINTHLGIEQSRRDDLEGIGYILLYFLRGSLPWQGLKPVKDDGKYGAIAKKKMTTPVETLCQGLPVEFASYVNYTRALGFEEKPDYGYLRKLFTTLFVSLGYQKDYVFDWDVRRMLTIACSANVS